MKLWPRYTRARVGRQTINSITFVTLECARPGRDHSPLIGCPTRAMANRLRLILNDRIAEERAAAGERRTYCSRGHRLP